MSFINIFIRHRWEREEGSRSVVSHYRFFIRTPEALSEGIRTKSPADKTPAGLGLGLELWSGLE